jgi:hypothetical protein
MRPSGEKERRLDGIVACVAAAALFVALYVGAYFALSEPSSVYYSSDASGVVTFRLQSFRYGGSRVEPFFWPLTQIDRLIRPGYWRREEPFMIPSEEVPVSLEVEPIR